MKKEKYEKYKMCVIKQKYLSINSATETANAEIKLKRATKLFVYKCKYGEHYHLTSKSTINDIEKIEIL